MTTVQPVRWRVAPLTQLERSEETWRQLHACAWASPVLAWEFIAALVQGFARGDEVPGEHRRCPRTGVQLPPGLLEALELGERRHAPAYRLH